MCRGVLGLWVLAVWKGLGVLLRVYEALRDFGCCSYGSYCYLRDARDGIEKVFVPREVQNNVLRNNEMNDNETFRDS